MARLRARLKSSLSARRAWIEITVAWLFSLSSAVALRKESVDRNGIFNLDGSAQQSLSARRAWIEMDVTAKTGLFTSSRSPQGERG